MTTATFGPYAVEELVAEGASVTIWRARHTELGRLVAIKALSARLCADPAAIAQLRSEARTLTGLDHPHIVAIYDFVEDAQPPYLVTEWVAGRTLRELLQASERLAPQQALGVLRGALEGLAYAHGKGLLHGDLSPSNLIVDPSGTTKLIDFGLAVPTGEPGVSGTPAYLSPEAASGQPLTPASDVYSAATVLYELLSGSPPFAGGDLLATLRAHREEPAPALRDHGPEVQALLSRALSKAPGERPADAAAFLSELEEAASRRYGAGWLSAASIAGLAGAGAAGGTAATAAAVSTASSGAVASTATGGVDGVATAAADTGAALPRVAHARRLGRVRHVAGTHPIATGAVAVVVVAAAATTAVVASSSSSSKPPPEAILLASSPQGDYVLTGTQVLTARGKTTSSKSGPFAFSIKENCTAKTCSAVVVESGRTTPFTYDGSTFVASKRTTTRVPCPDTKTGKAAPGDTALLHEARVWNLKVTKRAPDTADGPGRALELTGTEVLTQTASGFTGHCVNGGTIVYRFAWTLRQK